jgi:hypothetical protein
MSDEEIEKELQAKGLNKPRLSPQMIADTILAEQYYIFPGTVMTICCLTLQNGYNVIGTSAPVSPENFDEGMGRKIAKTKAVDQIWALEGYLLKDKLSKERN